MLQRSLILSILLFFSVSQAADFKVISASGGSFTETDESGGISLYGGIAGTCASPSSGSTCNTCTNTSTPAIGCNTVSVHSTLQIGITITTGAAITNRAVKVFTGVGSDFDNATQIGSNGTLTAAASTTVTVPVTLDWGDVCDPDVNFDGSCNPASTPTTGLSFESGRRIFVGIDADGDGIEAAETTSFPIYLHHIDVTQAAISRQTVCASPDNSKYGACGFALDVGGDEKLFLRDLILSASTPVVPSGAPEWYGVAFFHQDQTGQALDPANVSTAGTPIIKSYDVSDYSVDATLTGFTNYRDYCLVMGNINKAQNIFYLTAGGVSADNCGTPSEVVGLLDDKSCFISTAAFGSDMAEEVETFRQFRNHFLIPYDLGREFVNTYYELSPPMANFISQSEVLRFAARLLLYPFYFFSLLSLKFGFLYAALSAVMALLFLRQIKLFVQIWKSFGLSHRSRLKIFLILFSIAFLAQTRSYAQIFPDQKKVQKKGAQADGLLKIDKDGVYIYKPELQNTKSSSHLRVGMVSNPSLESEVCDENDQNCQVINFDDIYSGASGMGFEYLYEYYFFTETGVNFGKLGLQAGLSMSYAQGHGRLVSNLNAESIETYTFLTMPLFAGGIYRFEYRDRQILVPYAGGGGVYAVLAEKREDKNDIKGIGAPGFYGFAGALLNISALDRDLGSDFEAEYDIKNLWLSAEYKFISVQADAFSLENGYVQGGIGFDF
jgi:hypothetical protein